MPNPLSEAFQAAAKVRPEIADLVSVDGPHRWWMRSVPITESEAERLIEAACWRELPGWAWEKVGGKYRVFRWNSPGMCYSAPTLAIALLAAVAGLGGGE